MLLDLINTQTFACRVADRKSLGIPIQPPTLPQVLKILQSHHSQNCPYIFWQVNNKLSFHEKQLLTLKWLHFRNRHWWLLGPRWPKHFRFRKESFCLSFLVFLQNSSIRSAECLVLNMPCCCFVLILLSQILTALLTTTDSANKVAVWPDLAGCPPNGGFSTFQAGKILGWRVAGKIE